MVIEGRVWKFGDNVDTDLIIPARYLNVSDKDELSSRCFADVRPEFASGVRRGDIIVAGRNFGCGSSREHAPIAIKEAGISAIIAKSFARIFYRNAFNIALPILESENAADATEEGDYLTLDIASGGIRNKKGDRVFFAKSIPEFMREIITAGGLVEYTKRKLQGGSMHNP